MRDFILLYINGVRHELRGPETMMMLADYLRYDRQLTGTKIVCAEGDCGACTVLRRAPLAHHRRAEFAPINSCIATVAQMDGSSLVTIEGLKASSQELTPVQSAMIEGNGSQCGFCTPGFVMALTGLVERRLSEKALHPISAQEAKNYLTGNLCRCTGYQPIIEAATGVDLQDCQSVRDFYFPKTQHQELNRAARQTVNIEGPDFHFFAPVTLTQARAFLRRHPKARLLGAGTDLGVQANKNKFRFQEILSLHLVRDLYEMKRLKAGRFKVGARVTLSELRREIEPVIPEFARFLDLFASPQIKNAATLIGNVANASPIGDTPPFLLVTQTTVHLLGPKGHRRLPLEKFYRGYRKTALKAGEFITALEFDIPPANDVVRLFKSSQRKDLDIAAVNGALRLTRGLRPTYRIALGGVGPTPMRLPKTEQLLASEELKAELIEAALQSLQEEIAPISDLRGSPAFRRVLAAGHLRQLLDEIRLGTERAES